MCSNEALKVTSWFSLKAKGHSNYDSYRYLYLESKLFRLVRATLLLAWEDIEMRNIMLIPKHIFGSITTSNSWEHHLMVFQKGSLNLLCFFEIFHSRKLMMFMDTPFIKKNVCEFWWWSRKVYFKNSKMHRWGCTMMEKKTYKFEVILRSCKIRSS